MYVGSNRPVVKRLLREAQGDLRLIEHAFVQAQQATRSDTVSEEAVVSAIREIRANGNGAVKPASQ
jgi:hypothetical protein